MAISFAELVNYMEKKKTQLRKVKTQYLWGKGEGAGARSLNR